MGAEMSAEVTIMGLGWSTEENLDYLRQVKHVKWGINNGPPHYDIKVDRIIAMDDFRRDKEADPESGYVESIVNYGVPVTCPMCYPEWPSTRAYPIKLVLERLKLPKRVLSNTNCYALAYAMFLGYEKINLYGVDFGQRDGKFWDEMLEEWIDTLDYARLSWGNRGYKNQPDWFKYYHPKTVEMRRPGEPGLDGMCYLLGMCNVMGIKTFIPPGSSLLDNDRPEFLYGYQEQPDEV